MKRSGNINDALNALNENKLCILPTDTILGLFSSTKSFAVHKIFDAKKRDYSKPLAIFVPSTEEIARYGIETEDSRKFANENLPGAYTILLHATDYAKNLLCPQLISSDGKIGIRIPNQKQILEITKSVIICGTSVNISGQEFATSEIPNEIESRVEFFLETNQHLSQTPSTIIDFTQEGKIIRSV